MIRIFMRIPRIC